VLAAMLIVFVSSACAQGSPIGVELVHEIRGERLDLIHHGHIVVVDENSNVIFYVGDPEAVVFYRSISKPMQAMPTIVRDLDIRYNLDPNDIIIFSASHTGEPFHVEALERMTQAAGLSEDWYIMTDLPSNEAARIAAINAAVAAGGTRADAFRPFFHNCSGKHTSLLLLQRELLREQLGHEPTEEQIREYWKVGSLADLEVIKAMKIFAETENFEFGVDGCGVPVFAAPMKNIAITFKNFARPEKITDEALRVAATRYMPLIRNDPRMIGGTGVLCSFLNAQPNIVAKSGANAAYGFALIDEGIGVSIKLTDGSGQMRMVVMEVLRQLHQLGKLNPDVNGDFFMTDSLTPPLINAANMVVGERRTVFTLTAP